MDSHLFRTGKSFFPKPQNTKQNSGERPRDRRHGRGFKTPSEHLPARKRAWHFAARTRKLHPRMKLRTSLCTAAAVSLLPLALAAQVAPAPAGATPAPGAAATPAKKVPLSSADKQLIKSAAEPQLLLLHLSETIAGPTPPGSAAVQKLAGAAKKALNDAWGEIGTIALGKGGEMPPTTRTASETKELGELRKQTGDKFDKAFLKAFEKEAKRANAAFTSGSKFAQDAELKAVFLKYQPIIAKLEADGAAAEKEGKK